MIVITFTEFRNQASTLLNRVEEGEVIRVTRRGKPIADISPVSEETSEVPSWKRPGLKLTAKGASLSQAIKDERSASDYETLS